MVPVRGSDGNIYAADTAFTETLFVATASAMRGPAPLVAPVIAVTLPSSRPISFRPSSVSFSVYALALGRSDISAYQRATFLQLSGISISMRFENSIAT